MSTILDALRKVERERDPSADHTLDAPQISSEVRRRRRFPITPVLLWGAIIGFGGGAIVSWLLPAEPEVEVAALPLPPPPPAIPVPREPVRARPAAPPAPVADAKPIEPQAAGAPLAAPAAPVAVEAPPVVAAAPKPAAPPGVAPAPPAPAAPPVAAAAPPSAAAPPKPAEAVAALDKSGSALEPSPFAPAREAEREVPAPAANPPPKVAAVPKLAPGGATAPAAEPAHDTDIAAVAPAPPPEAALNEASPPPEAEPEPETPAETIIDTGRSPPNQPKVALSFLQWSADPKRRFAFISVDGAPSQRVQEGEVAGGLTVAAITKNGVQFKRDNLSWVIRPRH